MENPERDTKFQNFAKLLAEELRNARPEEAEKIIARRAYDLVDHALDNAPVREWDFPLSPGESQSSCIPDMTEWPP